MLRDYQVQLSEQANSLLHLFKMAYLCMEVRCGKTLTSLNTAKLHGAKRVLFVTKKKAISSIVEDFDRMGRPFELYVTNYEQLDKVEAGWCVVIVDEAHNLGAFPKPTNRAKELRRIVGDTPVIYLSGTPTPESYSQLYHQFWISKNSIWKEYDNFYKWHKDFGILAHKFIYNRKINDYSKTVPHVCEKFDLIKLSYTQEDAGFKAMVEEHILTIPMPEKVKKSIELIRKNKIFTTKDGQTIMGDTAVKEMMKVHQMCGGTVKSEEGEYIIFDDSKARFIQEKFKGQKIAIYYKYVAEGLALKYIFAGQVFEDAVEFNKSENGVYLSQIQSGREGVNISTADALIMYNIDFAAVSYWQARARIQTLDRSDPAKVYWVFMEGGIEQKIYDTVLNKKDFTVQHYKRGFK